MTPEELVACKCGGPLRLVDSHESSCTGWCTTCEHYSLVNYRPRNPVVIFLADFHLKRGDAPDQRPRDDFAMATRLVRCLLDDVWPSPATVVDYGIVSPRHLGALQHAVRSGCTAYDLDRVMGDGPAITQLVRSVPRQPYGPIEFGTPYDNLAKAMTDE